MKSLLLFSLCSVISMSTLFANENKKDIIDSKVSISVSSQNENVTLDFESYEDFEETNLDWLSLIFDSSEEVCSVTATVTVSYSYNVGGSASIGVASVSGGGTVTTTVSASVTASCSEINGAINRLRKTLTAAAMVK